MANTIAMPTYIGEATVGEAKKPKFFAVFEWFSLTKEENKDNLSFMSDYTYPKLENIKSDLLESGEYTQEQVEEILLGLSTLPEYRD